MPEMAGPNPGLRTGTVASREPPALDRVVGLEQAVYDW